MTVRDQLAHEFGLAQGEFQQSGFSINASPPRGRHCVKRVGYMPHPVIETGARFSIRRIAVTATDGDISPAQTID